MIRCRQARARILLAFDDRLDLERRFELDEHLRACSTCRDHDRAGRELEEALARRSDLAAASRIDVDELLRMVHATTVQRTRAVAAKHRRRWYAAALFVAGATAVVAALASHSNEPESSLADSGSGPPTLASDSHDDPVDAGVTTAAPAPDDASVRELGSWIRLTVPPPVASEVFRARLEQRQPGPSGPDTDVPPPTTSPGSPAFATASVPQPEPDTMRLDRPFLGSLPLLAAAAFATQAKAVQSGFTVRPGWPIMLSGASVDGGMLVEMDGDAELELVQIAGSEVHAFNLDGTYVTGWPVSLTPNYGTFAAPAFGDIDGDGQGEVVVQSWQFGVNGRLWVLERDGSTVPGFPLDQGGAIKAVALADVDGDGPLEIVSVTNVGGVGELNVVDGSGAALPGWPTTLDDVGGAGPAVGDLDGDGTPELVAVSFQSLYAYRADGSLLPGFPVTPAPQIFSYNTPSLADMDGDGDREIVVASSHQFGFGGQVHVFDLAGNELPGWPRLLSNPTQLPPSVGDIDGDGFLDVAVGDTVLSPVPVDEVRAWDRFGTALPGFPIGPLDALHAQIVLADIDGDGMSELVFDQNVASSDLQAYNHDGTPVTGWPLPIQGSSFQQSPTVADADGDGFVDLACSGNLIAQGDVMVYLWTSNQPFDASANPLPSYQYGPARDGVADGDPCALTTYCTAKADSLGCAAALAGSGTPSASAGSGFDVSFGPVPGGNVGLFLYSTQGSQTTPIANAFGFLCVSTAGLFRTAPSTTGGTSGACDGVLTIDFNAYIATQTADASLVAGATVDLQAWYRDPPNPGSANLSNAGRFSVCP